MKTYTAAALLFLLFATQTQSYIVTDLNDPLLGSSPCTYGPSYWCHNLTQSVSCSAFSHCLKNVWPSKQFPNDNDDVCKVCKEMVKEARDQLLSNQTQDELRQVLEGSCDLLPLAIVREQCKKVMDEFMPELVDALASRMDPEAVCSISGLCNNPAIDLLLPKLAPSGRGISGRGLSGCAITCPSCTTHLATLLNFLRNDTSALKVALLNQCSYLGSYSDSCKAVVMENLNYISSLLAKADAKEFCELIGICSEGVTNSVAMETKNDPDLECQFCTQLVTYLKTWLTQNTTKEEFTEIVTHLCSKFEKSKQQECVDFFRQYGNEIYRLIIDELDADEFCGRVGLCNGTLKEVWSFLVVSDDVPMEMKPLLPGNDFLPTCALCEFTVTKLINLIGRNHTKESIESATAHVCAMLPKKYSSQCNSFMENYGDQVIEMILIDGSSHEICAALHLCLFSQLTNDDQPKCVLCEYVISAVALRIKDNATEEEIKQEVSHICRYFPATVRDNCKTFIDNYGDEIISYLAQEMDPQEICTEMKLCKKNRRCELCRDFSHYFEGQIGKVSDLDALVQRGVDRCGDEVCTELIEDYGLYMIDLIQKNERDVCEKIDVC